MGDSMYRTLRLDRWIPSAALVAFVIAPHHLASQAPLVEHPLVFDMKISLPAGWISDSIPGLHELVARFSAWAPALTAERVQQLSGDFQRVPLLRARNAQRLTDQAIVVFTLLPGFHVREFESGAREQSASLAASNCNAYHQIVEGAGGSFSCDRYELREVDGRPAVVVFSSMRIESSGIDNHRTVVLVPIDGGLLSFTFSVHRTETDTSLAERVISSIRTPAR